MLATLLFTDVAGSTALAGKAPVAFRSALDLHFRILREGVARHGGAEFLETGDGLCAAFPDALQAVRFAVEAQAGLASAAWPSQTGPLLVRMAMHTGDVELRDGQYRGLPMNITARLLGAAHGGQTLCSGETRAAMGGDGAPTRRLGAYRLRSLVDLVEIFQLGEHGSFPPLRAAQARQHNLPPASDALIGRKSEIEALTARLIPSADARLVTLTGPGGIGKTRLALAVGHRLLDAYEHGVLYVPLVSATSASSVPFLILDALGALPEGSGDPVAQIAKILAGAPTLLILDNLEHLAAEGAAMLDRLMAALPHARLLATSLSRLGLREERQFPVPPFSLPEAHAEGLEAVAASEAGEFFVDRAVRARPDFALDEHNARNVGAICRLLDGVPLALELAAARLPVLTTTELLEALREDFGTIEDAAPAAARRLELVFDWSQRLLPPDIAGFLGVLSAFRSGWTAQSAACVGGIESTPLALAYLHYLLNCSLIQVAENTRGMRFTMLEPIRQMAAARLGADRQRIAADHSEYFRQLARRVEENFGTEREEAATAEIAPETENIFAALDAEPDNTKRIRAAGWFHQFAAKRSCNRRLRPILITVRADGGAVEPGLMARAWNNVMCLDAGIGDHKGAEHSHRMAIRFFEEAGEEEGVVAARFNLGTALAFQGRYQEAYNIARETYDYFKARGASTECAVVLANLANNSRQLGRLEEAGRHIHECLRLCNETGSSDLQATALCALGEVHLAAGDWRAAIAPLHESLAVKIPLGAELELAETLIPLCQAASLAGDYATAAFFTAAARQFNHKHGQILPTENQKIQEDVEQRCIDCLGQDAFREAFATGTVASPSQILAAAAKLDRDASAATRTLTHENNERPKIESASLAARR